MNSKISFRLKTIVATLALLLLAGAFVPLKCQPLQPNGLEEKNFFIRGSLEQMNGNFRAAIHLYKQALLGDSSAPVLLAIGQCYFQSENLDSAERYAQLALAADSSISDSWVLKGQVSIARLDLPGAVLAFEKARAITPADNVLYTLARLYEATDTDKAIELYEEMLAQNEHEEIEERLVELYMDQEDFDKALPLLERLWEAEPLSEFVLGRLGYTYAFKGQYSKLDKLVDGVVAARGDEKTFEAMRGLWSVGLMAAMMEDPSVLLPFNRKFAGAVEQYFPDDRLLWSFAGFSLFVGGDHSRSYELLTRLVERDSTGEAINTVILFALRDRQDTLILWAAAKAQEYYPENALFPFYEGVVHADKRDYGKALPLIEKSYRLDSLNQDVIIQLALLYSMVEKHEQSDTMYLKVLQSDPNNALANNNLAYSWSERGYKLDSCLTMSSKAIAAMPDNPSFLDTKGWIYYLMDDYENALRYIEEAIRDPNASPTIWEHYGDVLVALRQFPEAMQAWQRSLELDPGRKSILQKIEQYGK